MTRHPHFLSCIHLKKQVLLLYSSEPFHAVLLLSSHPREESVHSQFTSTFSGIFKPSSKLSSLRLHKCIVFCSFRKCSLDPAALSSYCCNFFLFYSQTFQISNLYLLPPCSLTYPGIRLLFLSLFRKELFLSHCSHLIINIHMAYLHACLHVS